MHILVCLSQSVSRYVLSKLPEYIRISYPNTKQQTPTSKTPYQTPNPANLTKGRVKKKSNFPPIKPYLANLTQQTQPSKSCTTNQTQQNQTYPTKSSNLNPWNITQQTYSRKANPPSLINQSRSSKPAQENQTQQTYYMDYTHLSRQR